MSAMSLTSPRPRDRRWGAYRQAVPVLLLAISAVVIATLFLATRVTLPGSAPISDKDFARGTRDLNLRKIAGGGAPPANGGRTLSHSWGSAITARRGDTFKQDELLGVQGSPMKVLDSMSVDPVGGSLLIVTNELAGDKQVPTELATFYTTLAGTASFYNTNVTVLYTRLKKLPKPQQVSLVQRLGEHFITLVGLPDGTWPSGPPFAAESYHVLQFFLSSLTTYDVIRFPGRGGLGYWPLVAKQQGWALQRSTVIVDLHGSSNWVMSNKQQLPSKLDDMYLSHFERRSVELADLVWSPTRYMHRYVVSRGWTLQKPAYIFPYKLAPIDWGPDAVNSLCEEGQTNSDLSQLELVFVTATDSLNVDIPLLVELLGLLPDMVPAATNASKVIFSTGVSPPAYDTKQLIWNACPACTFHHNVDPDSIVGYVRPALRLPIFITPWGNAPSFLFRLAMDDLPALVASVGGIGEILTPESARVCLQLPQPKVFLAALRKVYEGIFPCPKPFFRPTYPELRHMQLVRYARFYESTPACDASRPLGTVSVIITHYERPYIVMDALKAIASQTLQPTQVIVVDDGSSSETAVFALKALVEPYIVQQGWKLLTIDNSYLAAARNTGAQHATGDYLLFLDDDDVPEPNMVEKLATIAFQCDIDVLSTFFAMADTNTIKTEGPFHVWQFFGSALSMGLLDNRIGGANIFVRRSKFQSLGGFTDLKGLGYEDHEFLVRAIAAGYRHEVVPDPLLRVRKSPASMKSTMDFGLSEQRVMERYQSIFASTDFRTDFSDIILQVRGQLSQVKRRKTTALLYADHFSLLQRQYGLRYYALVLSLPPTSNLSSVSQTERTRYPHTLGLHVQGSRSLSETSMAKCMASAEAGPCRIDFENLFPVYLEPVAVPWASWRLPQTYDWNHLWVDASSIRPARISNLGALPYVVWTSNIQGNVVLSLKYSFPARCGDGICIFIFQNGVRYYAICPTEEMRSTGVVNDVRVSLELSIDSEVSLLIDPLEDHDCDSITLHSFSIAESK